MPANAADRANTAKVEALAFIPNVAQAAGLSLKAINRWPNAERLTATTTRQSSTKHRDPTMNCDSSLAAVQLPIRKGAKSSDPLPNGAIW